MLSWILRGANAEEIAPAPNSSDDISADWVDVQDFEDSDEKPFRVHNIVPSGDVVIVLNHSIICEDFIAWPEPHKEGPADSTQSAPKINEWLQLVVPKTTGGQSTAMTICEEQDFEIAPAVEGDEQDVIKPATKVGTSIVAQYDAGFSNNPSTMISPNAMPKVPRGPYQYQVSSTHLMAASPVLKDMLCSGEDMEKLRHPDGKIYFVARGVNDKALRVLLKILNHRTGGLPSKLGLASISMIAVLASQLECAHAVQFYGERWCEKEEQSSLVPQEMGQIVMMWLCSSLVFRREDRFGEAVQTIIRHSKVASLPSLGLPIQDAIDMIDMTRKETLQEAVACLFQSRDKYCDLEYVCKTDSEHSEVCASVMEGYITREMRKMGLFDDRTSPMVTNWSIEDMCMRVAQFQIPKWKTPDKRTHKCNFDELKDSFSKFRNKKIELKQVVGEEQLE